LQDETSSNSNTEGYNAGMGVSPSSMDPSAIGANENSSEANSQWVNNHNSTGQPSCTAESCPQGRLQDVGGETTLIGGTGGEGEVNISADKTTITGAVLASATRNEDGSLTDNGTLNLATNELIIEDIKDKDHSENEGFNISAGLSSSGSSSVGLTSDGHKKEQTNLATIGGGNITKKDGSAHEEELVASANSDLNNSQEITKDMKTGGLNATVVVDHRLVTEGGRETIANNFEDSYEHGEDIARAVDTIIESDDLGILNAGEGIHNNAMATQLKNDLVRNPENAHILEGLQSENPEEYNAATQALGKLAQEKFGLEASEINLYDGDETTSGTLANNALGDVAGGVVIDEANSEYGNIFIDAGDGATKTDMANTLGHEVLETQALQGKDGGVFGNNSEQTQEAMSNSFGEQFADRIDQAAGGDLNSTGGATFSSDLKNSNAVVTGTQNANKVGNATVDHRQLYVAEAKAIIDAAPAYAKKHDISEAEAKKELTQQALLQVDKEWSEQKHIVENERARDELAGISATKLPAKDGYVEGGEVGLFIATPDDYNNPYINANQASRIEDGAAGEKGFLTTNATENGTLPIELTPMEVVSETASGALIGMKNAGEALIDDFPSAMQSAASAVADTVSGCLDQGCIGSDPREGFDGDRAHVDLLQGDKESAIGNNASAMAGELLPAATVVNQTGRVIGGVAETIKDGLDNKLTSSDTTSSSLGQVDVDGEVIEQAGKSTDLSDVKPEANFSNINDPENTFRGPNSPEVLRADVDHSQQTGSRVTDPNREMPLVTESTAEAGSKGANLNTRKEFHDQRVVDAQQEIKSHGADTTSEVMVVSSNGEKARLDIAIAGTPNQSIPVPKGMIAEDRHGVPLPVQEIKLDNQGLAIAEVKTGKAKPERQQPECLAACEAGTATVRGEKIKRLDLEVGDKAPESVVVLRDPRDPVKDK
jgi:filamentous hemagglutinin